MAEVLRFGTDLQLRNRRESNVAEKTEEREREEEWHGITYAHDHRSVGANYALAADNKKKEMER